MHSSPFIFPALIIFLFSGLVYGHSVCLSGVCAEHLVAGNGSFVFSRDTIYKKKAWSEITPEAHALRDSLNEIMTGDFNKSRFATVQMRTERPEGVVSFDVLTTGEQKIDGLIRAHTEGFARDRKGKDTVVTHTSVSGKYISMVHASHVDMEYVVHVYNRDGEVDIQTLFIHDGLQKLIDAGATRLAQQKQVSLEVGKAATEDAFKAKHIRIADNGVVVLVDARAITENPSIPYHEVLVTNAELGSAFTR